MKDKTESINAGFSLVEVLIVLAIFAVVMLGIFQTLHYATRFYAHGSTQAELQIEAIKAMELMTSELRQGGVLLIDPDEEDPYYNGNLYPYIFADGDADVDGFFPHFSVHNHAPAEHDPIPGSSADGPTREIVFRTIRNPDGTLADHDGDGNATDNVTGAIEWCDDEISYVLITDSGGTNLLQRRVNGQAPRAIARDVERITFDTMYTDNQVRLYQVVISLYLDRIDPNGRHLRTTIVSTVNLRNAGEVF